MGSTHMAIYYLSYRGALAAINFVYAVLIDCNLLKFGFKNFVNLWLCMFEIICYIYQQAFSKIWLNFKWLFIVLISPIGYLSCLKLDAVWLLILLIAGCWLVAYLAWSLMMIGCLLCLQLDDDWLLTLPKAWWLCLKLDDDWLLTLPIASWQCLKLDDYWLLLCLMLNDDWLLTLPVTRWPKAWWWLVASLPNA